MNEERLYSRLEDIKTVIHFRSLMMIIFFATWTFEIVKIRKAVQAMASVNVVEKVTP